MFGLAAGKTLTLVLVYLATAAILFDPMGCLVVDDNIKAIPVAARLMHGRSRDIYDEIALVTT